jgi:hypothetical protein
VKAKKRMPKKMTMIFSGKQMVVALEDMAESG